MSVFQDCIALNIKAREPAALNRETIQQNLLQELIALVWSKQRRRSGNAVSSLAEPGSAPARPEQNMLSHTFLAGLERRGGESKEVRREGREGGGRCIFGRGARKAKTFLLFFLLRQH